MEKTNKTGKGSFIFILTLTIVVSLTIFVLVDVLRFCCNIDLVKDFECKGTFGIFEAQTLVFILMMNIFVIWNSVLAKGWKRSMAAFFLTIMVAFTAGALGVAYGLVFGRYYYTGVLGVQVLSVPLMVALAWEPVLYASFCLTEYIIPTDIKISGSVWKRFIPYLIMATVGGLAVTAWDLMLDPFAVDRGWWVWVEGGDYTSDIKDGVPISNFIGWFKVAFICHIIYRYFMAETGAQPKRTPYLSVYGPITLYALLLISAFGMSIKFLKHPEVAMIGVFCMGAFLLTALAKLFLQKKGFQFFQTV